jgi:RNA polymerase sigma-70 factor (sigma-E family)
VDNQDVGVVLDAPDTDLESASAAVAFLSAPPGDPVADAFTGGNVGDADAADDPGDAGGPALRAETAGLGVLTGPGNGTPGNGTPGNGASGNGAGILLGEGEPAGHVERLTRVTEVAVMASLAAEVTHAPAWDASDAVTEIYAVHYAQLVRLAVMLVHDVQTAEEVVQDAFEAMHLAWRRLRDRDKALSYLRQAIVNRSRSELRHRKVVEMHPPKPAPDEQSAEHAALVLIERSAVTSALRALPERQREAVVLRYYGDFSEADIAKAMGISRGAVKSHTARAMAALKSFLERES